MSDSSEHLIDGGVTGWWLYRLPNGTLVRVDVGRQPLRWDVDVADGEEYQGLTGDQVEALLRSLSTPQGR